MLVFAAVAVIPANAQGDCLIVLTKDGHSYETKMTDADRIEINAGNVVLSKKSGDSQSYAYGDIDRIKVWAASAGIGDITAAGNIAVWPKTVTETLNVAGAKSGTPIRVYTLGGVLVASATATDGTVCVDLGNAPAGYCIVSIGNKSVKIIKK